MILYMQQLSPDFWLSEDIQMFQVVVCIVGVAGGFCVFDAGLSMVHTNLPAAIGMMIGGVCVMAYAGLKK